MCGISVVLGRVDAVPARETLRRLHEPIAHRGPDGEGFLFVDAAGRAERVAAIGATAASAWTPLGLGFRRLKVRDLSEAAAQPLGSPDGTCWIAFNGEIDNFRELRGELSAGGRRFASTGDAEVALAAFEAWGTDCFRRFEGMWAIVIADLRRRRLVGSRDRFGIKPLYWTQDGTRLLLASEIKQLLNATDDRPRAHGPALARFLRGQRLPGLDDTFFAGVRAVPPATWFEVPFGEPQAPVFRPYWDLATFCCPEPGRPALTYAQAQDALRTALQGVVSAQDVADVTVGCLLSGGLDSALLAALLAKSREPDRKPVTFSFGMRGTPQSELPYVDLLIARTGWPNHQTGLDASWLAAHATRAVRALEEPPLSLAALAQYRVFQLCREQGATVVLDGHGADEVLAGYPYHQRTLLLDLARRGRWGALAREAHAVAGVHGTGLWAVLRETVRPALRHRLRPDPSWVAPGYGAGGDGAERRAADADRGRDPSRVNRQLYGDVKWGNAKIVLAFSDKNAMAHSVEARVPYLDRRVVELAFTLPDHYKVGGGQRKRVLRDAARGLLPAEITDRADRLGFALPEAELLRDASRALDAYVTPALLAAPCLLRPAAERLWSDYQAGRAADSSAAWRLAALGLWADAFGVVVA